MLKIPFEVLDRRLSEIFIGEKEITVEVCMEMVVLWQAYKADGGTYESFKYWFSAFNVYLVVGMCDRKKQPYLTLCSTGSCRS